MNTPLSLARIAPSLAIPLEYCFMVQVLVSIGPQPFADNGTKPLTAACFLPIMLSNRCSPSYDDRSLDYN